MTMRAYTSSIAAALVLASLALSGEQAPQQATSAPLKFPELPLVSPLGARNDLPNTYGAGVSWGQLPNGRKWGSTAGIATAPDGTIWALDRCGASGAGGSTCANSPLDPVLQFDTSGKFLRSLGAGLFVSPHKITVDRDGFIWVADNGRVEGRGPRSGGDRWTSIQNSEFRDGTRTQNEVKACDLHPDHANPTEFAWCIVNCELGGALNPARLRRHARWVSATTAAGPFR